MVGERSTKGGGDGGDSSGHGEGMAETGGFPWMERDGSGGTEGTILRGGRRWRQRTFDRFPMDEDGDRGEKAFKTFIWMVLEVIGGCHFSLSLIILFSSTKGTYRK